MANLGYIDPNPDGLNSINTEDLGIFVELVTTKKQRSEINVDGEQRTYRLQKGGKKVPVRFLKGSDIDGDGREELTTHYTEINTNFNEANPDLESIGITSIDIDFNSSYTPMIKINFTDVRGKLFEMGNTSPYNVFFTLPYPMFELTVKGYYGKAVTYCLHLTKFNGKLNDKTGNFEIQCEFIGYTYAFLSDMLMGLLRGVVDTERGIKEIEESKKRNPNFLPFNELNEKIKKLNSQINDLKHNDTDLAKISLGENMLTSMSTIKEDLSNFIKNITKDNGDLLYNQGGLIIMTRPYNAKGVGIITDKKDIFEKKLKKYVSVINTSTKAKSGSRYYLYPEIFSFNGSNYDGTIRKIDFFPEQLWGDGTSGYFVPRNNSVGGSNRVSSIISTNVTRNSDGSYDNSEFYDRFREIILDIPDSKAPIDQELIVFDLRKITESIANVSKLLKDDLKSSKKAVSKKLMQQIEKTLTFKPTIRNMVNILTEHVHILMRTLKRVAQEVEDSKDGGGRAEQLKNVVVNKSSDIADFPEAECANGNNPNSGGVVEINDILPFPDYKEKNEGVFEDTWVGDIAPNMPEVKYVEEILEALLAARKKDSEILEELDDNGVEWYPINPFDTSLMTNSDGPWEKFREVNSPDDAIRLMLLRMATFLGISNSYTPQSPMLTKNEISAMGRLEAINVFNNIENNDVKENLLLYGGQNSPENFYEKINNYSIDGNSAWSNASKALNGDRIFGKERKSISELNFDYLKKDSYADIKKHESGFHSGTFIVENNEFIYEDMSYQYIYGSGGYPVINTESLGIRQFIPLSTKSDDISYFNGNLISAKNNEGVLDSPTSNKDRIALRDSGDIFLGSMVGAPSLMPWDTKYDDGSTSIEIIPTSRYTDTKQGRYPTTGDGIFDGVNASEVFNFENIETLGTRNGVSENIGIFSGRWLTREIRKVKFSKNIGDYGNEIDSWLKFYGNTNKPFITGARKFNIGSETDSTEYDIVIDPVTDEVKGTKGNYISNCGYTRRQTDILIKGKRTSEDYGNIAKLVLDYTSKSDDNVTIPFIGFECYSPRDGSTRWSSLTPPFYSSKLLTAQYPIFGSELYHNQDIRGKAYLFLHSIPWNGLTTLNTSDSEELKTKDFNFSYKNSDEYNGKLGASTGYKNGITRRGTGLFSHHIRHFFEHGSAFVEAPTLWINFLGSVLWRYREKTDPIKWEKDGYSLIPLQQRGFEKPKQNKYCLINVENNDTMGFFVEGDESMLKMADFVAGNMITDWWNKTTKTLGNLINKDLKENIEETSYVSIERTISHMTVQMGQKLIDEFLNFSDKDTGYLFKSIRREYDIFYNDNGEEATDEERILTWLNWSENMKTNPNGLIGKTNGTFNGSSYLNPRIAKNYVIASRDEKYSTYFSENNAKNGANNPIFKELEKIRKSSSNNKYQECLDIARVSKQGSLFNFFLEMRGGVDTGQRVLFDAISSTKMIVSSSGSLWGPNNTEIAAKDVAKGIAWNEKDSEVYIKSFHEQYSILLKELKESGVDSDAELKHKLFNSIENSDIKLQLYKTIKSIYDKWVPGSICELELCGNATANLSKDKCPNLIDTFMFIDRAYNDIGDDFLINPIDMVKEMISDYNIGMYDYLARVLVANNFHFIPLPTFTNYNDVNEIESIFKPSPFHEMETTGGPTFVCMYLGEGSKNLNLGEDTQYPDDGFNLNDNKCLPEDFSVSTDVTDEDFENTTKVKNKKTQNIEIPTFNDSDNGSDNGGDATKTASARERNNYIPAFRVAYGNQNQNFFKNFQLDQSEFTETEESLQIIDDISNNKAGAIGQNLYNVYRTRSYSATIDMLGNSQIQPFMYFQLDNVPMFSGAYTIIRVSHKITPNHMSTQFKGVRVRKTRTPMVDSTTVIMNLIGSIGDVDFSDIGLDGLYDMGASIPTGTQIYDQLNHNLPGKPAWAGCISYELPLKGLGLEIQSIPKYKNGTIVNYCILEVGKVINQSAAEWYSIRKSTTSGDTIYYNDLSRIGGGNLSGHKTHKNGTSIDFRQPRRDKKIATVNVFLSGGSLDPNYDRPGAIKLTEIILNKSLESGYWTDSPVNRIYFADPEVTRYFNEEYKHRDKFVTNLVSNKGHNDHIHFEWNLPDRVKNDASNGYLICGDSTDKGLFGETSIGDEGSVIKLESRVSGNKDDFLGKI